MTRVRRPGGGGTRRPTGAWQQGEWGQPRADDATAGRLARSGPMRIEVGLGGKWVPLKEREEPGLAGRQARCRRGLEPINAPY
jgi:hypothetical protein